MSCPVGRDAFDAAHRTCRSCEVQGLRACTTRHKRTRAPARSCVTRDKALVVYGKDLATPNLWTNKHNGDHLYRAERNAWEKACLLLPLAVGKATGPRYLVVTRVVPDRRYLIRDETNRQGSLKPLEDALVRLGVLLDDDDASLTRDILQEVGDDPRVEIRITEEEAA